MSKPLPHRPNLDHLRRQAKSLLAALAAGDAEAIVTFQNHLPAAKSKSADQITAAGFRLADAQSAVARRTGFESWPQLARHVEQLRSLEGIWDFESLVIGGKSVPLQSAGSARLHVDGDRFRMVSPGMSYAGVFNIDVEPTVHHIDFEFLEGHLTGSRSFGIFRLTDDRLEIGLDMRGTPRPATFESPAGSQLAYEVLRRVSKVCRDGDWTEEAPHASANAASRRLTTTAHHAPPTTTAVNRLVPLAQVRDVDASVAFYAMLGFTPSSIMRDAHGNALWALAGSDKAEIMLARASGPIDSDQQAVLFYMYSPDIAGLRRHLLSSGVRDGSTYSGAQSSDDGPCTVFEIAHRDYMDGGEMRVVDPDGYVILIGQPG